jgi:hypothetical protein
MDIKETLRTLYEIINKNEANLNYENNTTQTEFGIILEKFLILITNNCSNTINNIFNNKSNIIINILGGCYIADIIYEFYKNFNNNPEKTQALQKLLNRISIDKYKQDIEDIAFERGLIVKQNIFETLGIHKFIQIYFQNEYNNNKTLNLISFLKGHYNGEDIDEWNKLYENNKIQHLDVFLIQKYGEQTILDLIPNSKKIAV